MRGRRLSSSRTLPGLPADPLTQPLPVGERDLPSLPQRLLRVHELEAEVAGDRGVGDLAGVDVEAA